MSDELGAHPYSLGQTYCGPVDWGHLDQRTCCSVGRRTPFHATMREFGGRSAYQHSSGRVDGFEKRTAIIYLRLILQLGLETFNN